jgi:hypothetical protein
VDELIVLLIKLIIRAFDKAGKGSGQEQMRQEWERQRRWQEQQGQYERDRLAGEAAEQFRPAVARATAPPPMPRRPVPRAAADSAAPRQEAALELVASLASATASAAAARPSPARRTFANAPALARWMRPETLRRQFILTEILKPPVGLRPPRL